MQAHVPGTIQKVVYHFDAGKVSEQTNPDLRPVTHTYKTSGEYFPVVTIQTSVGRFSSLSSGFWFLRGTRINVQKPPVLISTIKIADPVDLKWTASSNLYVLSGSAATITEFDATGSRIRSLKKSGGTPTGFDVDRSGNVYIALSASNQVWKFKPTTDSFEVDSAFGNGGFIGNRDGTSGATSNELNAPFDIAVAAGFEGEVVLVADSGNHRIERFDQSGRFLTSGGFHVGKDRAFISSFGERGTNQSQFDRPQGLACDNSHLFIADSGNNRVVVAEPSFGPLAASGEAGSALGQFRAPSNVSVSDRGICVVDPGNNRIQFFDPVHGGERGPLAPFNPRFSLSSELGLKQPRAAVWANDLLEEKIYIADTANNRVILVKLPADTPETVWDELKDHLRRANIEGALACFASISKEKYRQTFLAMETKELVQLMSQVPPIKPVVIENDTAQYRFEQDIHGQTITFPIVFVKENGKWKIMEY